MERLPILHRKEISGARAPDGTHWIATTLRASQ
jgi:hypothetical protein